MGNRIVSVDEAIRLLTKFKKSGGQNVMIAEQDTETGISTIAIPRSINHGIMLIKTTSKPISYAEGEVSKCLQTKMPPEKIKTILFG